MTEKITITAEFDDGSKHPASIEQECIKADDIWMWLPDAFRAVGFTAIGNELEKARGE